MGEPVRLRKNGKVWVKDDTEGWVAGTIIGREKPTKKDKKDKKQIGQEEKLVVLTADGEKRTVNGLTECQVRLVDSPEELGKFEDLTQLHALHEPALLAALHERYLNDEIYTFSGKVLLAVNPYKTLKGLYGSKVTKKYLEAATQRAPVKPHVYTIATQAFKDVMTDRGRNQTILVSGESGAGKTETTKIIMRSITQMSQLYSGSGGQVSFVNGAFDISERVLQSNPILEAFGNASTMRNDNSSRFGKLIQLKFSPSQGGLLGAHVTSYLLEKSRLVHQGIGERNYHIFYAMVAGASDTQVEAWGLDDLSSFNYILDEEGVWTDPEGDTEKYRAAIQAMRVLGFSEAEIGTLLSVTAGILHLGNIDFVAEGDNEESSRISPDDDCMTSCAAFCSLLQIDADELERALCKRIIRVKGSNEQSLPSFAHRAQESFEKPLPREQAIHARDALAMALYERLFGWLVWRINSSIGTCTVGDPSSTAKTSNRRASRDSPHPSSMTHAQVEVEEGEDGDVFLRNYEIGILDVFGFEVFDKNGFEQFCINYCNEHLQQLFNEFVLFREQKEYEREGIDWTFIEYPDNKACLDMVESRPMGLIALVDENCLYPKGDDQTLCNKAHSHLPKSFPNFLPPTKKEKANQDFTILHFAGEVTYSMEGFTRKNRNQLRQEAVDLILSSTCSFVQQLFPSCANEAAGGSDIASYFDNQLGSTYPSVQLDSPLSSGFRSPMGGRFSASSPASSSISSRASAFGSPKSSAPQGLQQKTVLSHFKQQLHCALRSIRASRTHFIRCLKPNDLSTPGIFDRVRILQQLRYSGVVQIIQVARAGFPSRYTFVEFAQRYAILSQYRAPFRISKLAGNVEGLKRVCKQIVKEAGLSVKRDVQLGKTKIFLRQNACTALEICKDEMASLYARVIQRAYRHVMILRALGAAATQVQRVWRGFKARYEVGELLELRFHAAAVMQGVARGFLVRLRARKEKERVLIQAAIEKQKSRQAEKEKEKTAVKMQEKRVKFDLDNIKMHMPLIVYPSVADEFEGERLLREAAALQTYKPDSRGKEESKSGRGVPESQVLTTEDAGNTPKHVQKKRANRKKGAQEEEEKRNQETQGRRGRDDTRRNNNKDGGKHQQKKKKKQPEVEESTASEEEEKEDVGAKQDLHGLTIQVPGTPEGESVLMNDSGSSDASTSSTSTDSPRSEHSNSDSDSDSESGKSGKSGKKQSLLARFAGQQSTLVSLSKSVVGKDVSSARLTAAVLILVVSLPLIFAFGGLTSLASYVSSAVMVVWVYTHVLMVSESPDGKVKKKATKELTVKEGKKKEKMKEDKTSNNKREAVKTC